MVGPQIVLFGGGGGVGVGRGFRTDTGPAHATRLHPIMDAYPTLAPSRCITHTPSVSMGVA